MAIGGPKPRSYPLFYFPFLSAADWREKIGEKNQERPVDFLFFRIRTVIFSKYPLAQECPL